MHRKGGSLCAASADYQTTMSDIHPHRWDSGAMHEMHWYAVSTKANHEQKTEQNIRRLGVECFLPLLQERRIVRRVRKTIIGPLFPGYLFVRVNLTEHYRAVTYARGVRKIVGFGSSPVQVDMAVIDAIKSRMTDSNVCVLEKPKEFMGGQLVQIKDGPLVGLEAVFVREMPGRQRAMVLLHTLALQARVEVNLDQLASYVAA
jgi:transcriptional antiterminator RfaH